MLLGSQDITDKRYTDTNKILETQNSLISTYMQQTQYYSLENRTLSYNEDHETYISLFQNKNNDITIQMQKYSRENATV